MNWQAVGAIGEIFGAIQFVSAPSQGGLLWIGSG